MAGLTRLPGLFPHPLGASLSAFRRSSLGGHLGLSGGALGMRLAAQGLALASAHSSALLQTAEPVAYSQVTMVKTPQKLLQMPWSPKEMADVITSHLKSVAWDSPLLRHQVVAAACPHLWSRTL